MKLDYSLQCHSFLKDEATWVILGKATQKKLATFLSSARIESANIVVKIEQPKPKILVLQSVPITLLLFRSRKSLRTMLGNTRFLLACMHG